MATKPFFNEQFNTNSQPTFDAIPLIDLAPWKSRDWQAQERLARLVQKTCCEVGFMYIQGHSVAQELIERTMAVAKDFFALPEAEKRLIHYEQTGHNRGYLPLRVESTDPAAKADWKEAFDCGLVVEPDDPGGLASRRMTVPNLWPQRPAEFRTTAEAYFAA